MIEAEWGSFKYYQLKGENTLQLLGLALQEGVRQNFYICSGKLFSIFKEKVERDRTHTLLTLA